ncbi:hypothetical protein BUY11_10815 [Staphylococcus chromogenes]|uniref:hypothetical protein n=1 Tax=Staphylococcus TaxID=1279 RepID=UPI000D1A5607|nr:MULTISPECIES: hypothetical protein [Staphylococcus]MCE4960593.1 hypothetical protein [Staphylococcus chromogenes]PTF40681.1 hypothetical protein BUY11_10815 [Staphylococcus chromogenes]PTG04407.1 hypothetical protein BU666_01935 [Staphylococcus chromogenes]PTG58814.1 hypothetical protein BU691_05430 [Staphylococcus chromogenes]PTG98984.1 hypothetical protein BU636_10325 [Staphylococcus chromogenes]
MSDFITLEKTDWYKKLIQECDSYKQERDTLIEDIAKLRAERDEYKQKIIFISNQYSTEIEQALNNKDLNESLFLLEKLKMDLDEVFKNDTR